MIFARMFRDIIHLRMFIDGVFARILTGEGSL
jgi:hypothetical protein